MSKLGWDPPVPGLPESRCGAKPYPRHAQGWGVYWHDLYHPTWDHGSCGRVTVCECSTASAHGWTEREARAEMGRLAQECARGQARLQLWHDRTLVKEA